MNTNKSTLLRKGIFLEGSDIQLCDLIKTKRNEKMDTHDPVSRSAVIRESIRVGLKVIGVKPRLITAKKSSDDNMVKLCVFVDATSWRLCQSLAHSAGVKPTDVLRTALKKGLNHLSKKFL